MKGIQRIISLVLALSMLFGMVTVPVFAEEPAVAENAAADNTVLTEPFDVTYEEEVDAGLYPYDEKTVLVKLAKKADALDADGVASIEYLFKAKDGFWYTANLADGTTPNAAIEVLRNTDGVLLAEYNYIYEAGATTLCDGEGIPDDVKGNGKHKDQWHLDSCGFQKAWKKLKNDKKNPGGDSGVIVAVIDTGVDYDHEDLKNNMWVNSGEIPGDGIDNDSNGYVDDYYGVNIVANKGNGDDDHCHGTHVAGIIAAGNNNVGVVGLAYNTKIMAIKAGQASGNFLQTDICKAINYARENGADVINMSFGGTASSIAVQDALEEAYTHCVLVAAAGNDSKPNEGTICKPCYPAAFSFVLGVMAVDDYGVESSFTNYDVKAFNDVEYELYAPGNAITSTIPNDRYATLNGTSMAAPIVSAMAAVLRSVYNDPDKYPTKFIYGQLASTSERHAECLDPEAHGLHNLPQIANLYDALYNLPKPDVSVSEYKTFDTVSISSANNGDGTIDAGEVIALGFELRNRWGMSEDTVVTIDALSPADIPNPYVEFSADGKNFASSASIDYGSVGTYSTQDCGKVMENELWTGWENPFYVKVAKDAPNETILAINVTVTCKNALDEEDKTTYSSETAIDLITKFGVVLPQVIDEDMTLTKDNYYIIQNATVIEAGATVTVTEGTNIQFWTNDSTNPYADQYMASLVVKGKLNTIGTESEPVKIFPSNLMSNYRVEIYESGNGEINYNYTNITNLYTGTGISKSYGFTKAKNCEFTQNYKKVMPYRILSNGAVVTNDGAYDRHYIYGGIALNCAFYKLGSNRGQIYYTTNLDLTCQKCIFVDSFIKFESNLNQYTDCVFYGNNNYWDSTTSGGTSDFAVYHSGVGAFSKSVKNEETGITYIEVEGYPVTDRFAEYLGGSVCVLETEEEFNFLKSAGMHSNKTFSPNTQMTSIIELSDNILIDEIEIAKEIVTIDNEGTYQVRCNVYPSTASGQKLRYFSSNEAVATVDESGLVTPALNGVTTIYVFSNDMVVHATMQIVVVDEVKAANISAPETLIVDIGSSRNLDILVTPENNTKGVTYTTNDESIATVDENGNVTAISEGYATITATIVNRSDEIITAETLVHCTNVSHVTNIYIRGQNGDLLGLNTPILTKTSDTWNLHEPHISPSNATIKTYKWVSSNPDVCYIDDGGNFIRVARGVSKLRCISDDNGMYDEVIVYVSDDDNYNIEVKKILGDYALLSDGSMYKFEITDYNYWETSTFEEVRIYYQEQELHISDFVIEEYLMILDDNGNVYRYDSYNDTAELLKENVAKIYGAGHISFVVCNDGTVWARGVNDCGVSGITDYVGNYYNYYDQINFFDSAGVDDIYIRYINDNNVSAYFQCWDNVYVTGCYNGINYTTPTQILSGVYFGEGTNGISSGYADGVMLGDPDKNMLYLNEGESYYINSEGNYVGYYISSDGKLRISSPFNMNDLCNDFSPTYDVPIDMGYIKNVFVTSGEGVVFYVTEDNRLYTIYDGNSYFVPLINDYEEPAPAIDTDSLNLHEVVYDEEGNITSAILLEDTLKIGFNTTIYDVRDNVSVYGNTWYYAVFTENFNQLALSKLKYPNNGNTTSFDEGQTYRIDISRNAIKNSKGMGNEKEISITFTYQPDYIAEDSRTDTTETENHTHIFEATTTLPTVTEEGNLTNSCECGFITTVVLPKILERSEFTAEDYRLARTEFIEKGFNTNLWNSAILNRLNDDDVTKWMRIIAPTGETKYGFGGNWWGTTNPELINHQIVDYNDFITLGDIIEGEILTVAPENTFPFVTEAYVLDAAGEVQSVVSGGKVKFVVKFNRDMDMDYGAKVFFGSSYPYADYEIEGSFADARTWVGETELKTVIENGYQFIRVSNGRTAADENGAHLKLYDDWARFGFEIDTTSAMAMMMQGYADTDGIHLEWMQDDYETLAGYSVYRSTAENGNYVRLNKTVIPAEENTFTDTDVEPGKKYYYTFKVVLTDASESKPAGKISVTAKDTMAPSVYHSPVYTATTGNKVIISATVSDNIGVQNAKLYYRVKGTDEWKTADMTKTNSKYTASIPASAVTLEGVEYYIAAFDGVNYTYAGSRTSENPYEITVYLAVENNAKGDVDGDGNITVLDALKLLRAIYDETLLTQEEFLRADINGDEKLSAVEALRILQYANKTISSVLW